MKYVTFVLATAPGQVEDLGLFSKNKSVIRRSARAQLGGSSRGQDAKGTNLTL